MDEYVFTARLISGGRVVIPIVIREALNLKDGDIVELKLTKIVKRGGEP